MPLLILFGLLWGGALSVYHTQPAPVEMHPYDRCVQVIGEHIADNLAGAVNPVQVEMLIDSCLKKRERNSK